jgi:hypothetical protein
MRLRDDNALEGDALAGEDIAVVLLNGKTWIRLLQLIPESCGLPDPLDPELENKFRECPSLIQFTRTLYLDDLNVYRP